MALRGRPWKALLSGGRRAPWINGGLAVGLVVAVVLAFAIIGNPTAPPTPVRTAVVSRGNVTATVTGTGNAASQTSIPLSFETDGTVTAVNVKAGDTVAVGQVLATVDSRAQQENLRTAQANYANALANYRQTAAGPTDVQRRQDEQAITEAQQGIENARTQLANDKNSSDTDVKTARVQLSTDTTAQNTAVSQARTNASAACNGIALQAYSTPLTTDGSSDSSSAARLAQMMATTTRPTTTRTSTPTSSPAGTTSPTTSRTTTSPTTATTAPGTGTSTGATTAPGTGATSTASSTSTGGSCTSAKQDLKNAENTRDQVLQKDRLAITSAEQTQDATQDKDQQAIVTAQNQVRDAQLTQQANLHPNTPAQIAASKAQVDSAQVSVDTARRELDGTSLKSTLAGVVLVVNGKVGESSSQTSSANSNNASGSSNNTASAASSATTSAGQGFLAIANPSRLKVTANVAEADAANLQLGQEATVDFPATNNSAKGTVTEIQPQSTVTNNVVLYPVEVSLDTAPEGVKTGSTADLAITKGQSDGVLQVPTAAITTNGDSHTVTVQRDGTDTVVPVGVGLQGTTTTEITSGLQEGDTVVLPTPTAPATNAPTGGFPRLGGGAR